MKDPTSQVAKRKQPTKESPVGPVNWRAGHEVNEIMKGSNFLLTSAWDASWKLLELQLQLCHVSRDFGNS